MARLALLRQQFLDNLLRGLHILWAVGPFHLLDVPVVQAGDNLLHLDTVEILELDGANHRRPGRRGGFRRLRAHQRQSPGRDR